MILVIAGTLDGRRAASFLSSQGYEVMASVISSYGASLLREYPGLKINSEALDTEGFIRLIKREGIKILVDASHPYAANASLNAMDACERADISYIRYERPETKTSYKKAYYVDDIQAAIEKAAQLGDNIFLTTGSNTLEKFAKSSNLANKRLVCRILPEPKMVEQARNLGFLPKDIVALQGPFSKELNKELFRKYGAQVIISKNSGEIGGADTKFVAAEELNLPIVIINRPQVEYKKIAFNHEELIKFIQDAKIERE